MGSIRLGVDTGKALALRDQYGLKCFIETGTYKAQTTLWAAEYFEKVITIEAYEPRYRKLIASLGNGRPKNATFMFGDSRTFLATALRKAKQPALLYLDAHWCGLGAHDSNGDECPLKQELEAVLASRYADQHVIMIDDARLFLNPPPYPHDPAQWMTYAAIESMLAPRTLYVAEDVIYAEPV